MWDPAAQTLDRVTADYPGSIEAERALKMREKLGELQKAGPSQEPGPTETLGAAAP